MKNRRSALILGATGLIGSHVVDLLLANSSYEAVTAFVRKPSENKHEKLQEVVVDFDQLTKYREFFQVDELYICLGTTRKKAGSKSSFKKVDYDYVVQASKLAKEQGVKQLAIVSSIGANPNSAFFYSKVKGEMERAISHIHIPATYIFRPSLLLGSRQEVRIGEKLAERFGSLLKSALKGNMEKYRPVEGIVVAKSMIAFMRNSKNGTHIVESDLIEKIGSL